MQPKEDILNMEVNIYAITYFMLNVFYYYFVEISVHFFLSKPNFVDWYVAIKGENIQGSEYFVMHTKGEKTQQAVSDNNTSLTKLYHNQIYKG